MNLSNKYLNFIIGLLALLTGLYGYLNKLIPSISSDNYLSIILIFISSFIIIFLLYKVARNPLNKEPSTIYGYDKISGKYSQFEVWCSRITIIIILISIPFGVIYNLNKIKKRDIIFITESVRISQNDASITFNVTNNTNTKILISSFKLVEYKEESSCDNYIGDDRFGLILSPDSATEGTIKIDPGDIRPFIANIKLDVYSCTFKAFDILFRFNDVEGNVFYKKSDAIYFIESNERIEYLNPDRFELLLQPQNQKSFTYGYSDRNSRKFHKLAIEIYEKHLKPE